MNKPRRIASYLTLALALSLGLSMPEAQASRPPIRYMTIGNDSGGYIIKYALRMMKIRQSGALVKFNGRCDSACTLFLAIPSSHSCTTNDASFRFHLPLGSSESGNKLARDYMLRNYPGWVRSWIRQKGGLSHKLITMNASYAQKFTGAC